MKIVTDFDGVLTHLTEEAVRVRELFSSYISDCIGLESAFTLIRSCEERMRETPSSHGWRSNLRVTAFSNEDGFIFVNGLAACMQEEAMSGNHLAADALSLFEGRGVMNFSQLSQKAFLQMTEETEKGSLRPMDAGVGRVLLNLITAGHEVVVVSNSGTERIRKILGSSEVGSLLNIPNPRIRVRGNARKYELGSGDGNLQFENFTVFTDRPVYRSILLEERPHIVIGDVFSLDLALPISLATQDDAPLKGTKIFLRRRDYTPRWSLGLLKSIVDREAQGGILERFDELLNLD